MSNTEIELKSEFKACNPEYTAIVENFLMDSRDGFIITIFYKDESVLEMRVKDQYKKTLSIPCINEILNLFNFYIKEKESIKDSLNRYRATEREDIVLGEDLNASSFKYGISIGKDVSRSYTNAEEFVLDITLEGVKVLKLGLSHEFYTILPIQKANEVMELFGIRILQLESVKG